MLRGPLKVCPRLPQAPRDDVGMVLSSFGAFSSLQAGSAAACAYLCTLPTAMEGGTGLFTPLATVARRLGRAGSAFGRSLREAPPVQRPRRRWHV